MERLENFEESVLPSVKEATTGDGSGQQISEDIAKTVGKLADETAIAVTTVQGQPVSVKRGPGRPRKIRPEDESGEPPVKRLRGRPRKRPLEGEGGEPKVKRPRGRPRPKKHPLSQPSVIPVNVNGSVGGVVQSPPPSFNRSAAVLELESSPTPFNEKGVAVPAIASAIGVNIGGCIGELHRVQPAYPLALMMSPDDLAVVPERIVLAPANREPEGESDSTDKTPQQPTHPPVTQKLHPQGGGMITPLLKRQRGRPRKHPTPADQPGDVPIKKKRGRPKKHPLPSDGQIAINEGGCPFPIKKKRGRPKKHPLPVAAATTVSSPPPLIKIPPKPSSASEAESVSSLLTHSAQAPVAIAAAIAEGQVQTPIKRKRGRPRKNPLPQTAALPAGSAQTLLVMPSQSLTSWPTSSQQLQSISLDPSMSTVEQFRLVSASPPIKKKRGRPRKYPLAQPTTVTSGHPLATPPQLSSVRAMPLTISSPTGRAGEEGDAIGQVPKKRDKPRKYPRPDGQPLSEVPVKRKRGRPPKHSLPQQPTANMGEPPVKRKRGRPPKVRPYKHLSSRGGNAAEKIMSLLQQLPVTKRPGKSPLVKRKRGRPRKHPLPAEVSEQSTVWSSSIKESTPCEPGPVNPGPSADDSRDGFQLRVSFSDSSDASDDEETKQVVAALAERVGEGSPEPLLVDSPVEEFDDSSSSNGSLVMDIASS